LRCQACSGENPDGMRFCGSCGAPLAAPCASCGAEIPPGNRFCGYCGASVGAAVATAPAAAPPFDANSPAAPPTSPASFSSGSTTELRHVSVLFCDLVGFTPLAESKDPEEVRELLSGYFELARAIVSRYGGVVEKFIGDAVMAVWGAPVAREDDAERAVRAGLDLVAAVSSYGSEQGSVGLTARVGVVTGTAATTETAEEGFVVGDRVNTAARIQSVAPPGCCYVDESTKRATDAAVAYSDAGSHELKGKAEPVQLYRALRVVAGVGGALKSEGLEAPFVGRDRELRLVKDLFHASAEEGRAHLVSVTGIAGIGKSRLAWEFYKYLDGLSSVFRWHRGRCLSYGEGVAYWALAEMVRGRAGILEGEDAGSAASKLHAAVDEHLADPEERRWVEPRLAHLLGIEERSARDKEDLFAAWRLFFERMSEVHPVVMSFEDMQWADASLLDFIEYLLDWSRNHAIFVLTLSRPEIVERRANWGAGRRNFTSIYLEPLSPPAMRELVTGLVPGLPDEVRDRILDHSEGVPLYAVETVRMLIDRGLLVREGASYRPAGPLGALDVPETLHALIAARLDGLSPGERGLLQEAAVLGKTFSKQSLAALCGVAPDALGEHLASLVRKEVISLQADPRSPDRGQYAFLQDLVRVVAYETLPKRDRKDKHLAVAAYLVQAWGSDEDEFVEVVASHYLEAYRLAPNAGDAGAVKAKAREMIMRAGERAAALAAADGAQRYFEQALELTDDAAAQAALHERAGQMAVFGGKHEEARAHFEEAISTLDSIGQTHASARVSARLGEIDYLEERLEQGIERMERAFTLLADEEPDADLASLAAQLGRLHVFSGAHELAAPRLEFALALAEKLHLPEQMSQALNSKAVLLRFQGRFEESTVLLEHALQVALDNDLSAAALRAYNNLAAFFESVDRSADARALAAQALELARRVGDRAWEMGLFTLAIGPLAAAGEWDEALERVAEVRRSADFSGTWLSRLLPAVFIHVHQGRLDLGHELLEACSSLEHSEEIQSRSSYSWVTAVVLRAEGRYEGALAAAAEAAHALEELSAGSFGVKLGLVEEIEAAAVLDPARAEALLSELEKLRPGETTPLLRAQAARLRAKLAPAAGEQDYSAAVTMFRELSAPFWLAVSLLEQGERLVAREQTADADRVLAEAREIFERLHARPWLERLSQTTTVETISA
jgi:predicted ATPase/class 3 adenylate cyclase